MFKQILVPLDGSSLAERALPIAARIARNSGAQIHLLQVVNPVFAYAGGLAADILLTEQQIDVEVKRATKYLKEVMSCRSLQGIETTSEVILGSPAQQVLFAASSLSVDLIVLCSHGRTGLTRWFLGSVARTLAHSSPVPLLIVNGREPASLESEQSRRMLIPLDGSPLAETALEPGMQLLAALSAPLGGTIQLVQVVKLIRPTVGEVFISGLNDDALQRAKTYLAQVAEGLQPTARALNLSIDWSVALEEDVANALLDIAQHGTDDSVACDLVAISTHGRSTLQRIIMGSVAERLLSVTKQPMLIVRPPQEKDA